MTWSIRQWIKTLAFLNHWYLRFLSPRCPHQHPHHHLRCLPPSHTQVDQSVIISFLLAMRTPIPSLCCHLRRRTNDQLQCCHACVSLCAIDCERLQIALAYSENTFTGRPSIPILSFPRRTFTKLEELITPAQHPCRYHLLLQFIETKQLK